MKNQKKFDPFANLVLDKEEQELETAFENGEYEVLSEWGDINQMIEVPNLLETKPKRQKKDK